jgi:organic hydroperoxide reductase OsmC/OhrA
MSEHKAIIRWQCDTPDFLRGRYSRAHTWHFDGGVTVPASSAPSAVPVPLSNAANVDPEEAFVASLASCHMLTFLYFAWRGGFHVQAYEDEAVGTMAKNEHGKMWVNRVTLNPDITWGGERRPTPAELAQLHHAAHADCFIANSVKTEVVVSGVNAGG